MDNTGLMVGLGLIAATLGVIAYVRYRAQETARLHRGTQLARELRELAADDPVRLAAVDEYEVTLYQRLFYTAAVAPKVRGAAWALLAAVLAAFGALVTSGLGNTNADLVAIGCLVVTVVFAISAIVLAVLAGYTAATTPRVSFADSV